MNLRGWVIRPQKSCRSFESFTLSYGPGAGAAGGCGARSEDGHGTTKREGVFMSDDVHEVYAIKYGHHSRPASANYIDGDPHDVLQPLDFFVWAIVGPSGTIVVKTGFDEAMGKKRQREMIKPVHEGLAALGIAPDSVKDVIISHLHYDHCGNYDLF